MKTNAIDQRFPTLAQPRSGTKGISQSLIDEDVTPLAQFNLMNRLDYAIESRLCIPLFVV